MESDPLAKTVRERLDEYGLAHREPYCTDMALDAGQELVLSISDARTLGHIVHLRPRTPHELKRWIGVPDAAARTSPSPSAAGLSTAAAATTGSFYLPPEDFWQEDSVMQANLSAFLLGGSSAITTREFSALERYIDRTAIVVSVYLVRDIYVAAGARLIVGGKIHVLFARAITLASDGQVSLESPLGKIDCAGLKRHVSTVDREAESTPRTLRPATAAAGRPATTR